MKRTLIVLAALILVLPSQVSAEGRKHGRNNNFRQATKSKVEAHRETQKAENKNFRESVKSSDMPQDQRLTAVKEHRETQRGENIVSMNSSIKSA